MDLKKKCVCSLFQRYFKTKHMILKPNNKNEELYFQRSKLGSASYQFGCCRTLSHGHTEFLYYEIGIMMPIPSTLEQL